MIVNRWTMTALLGALALPLLAQMAIGQQNPAAPSAAPATNAAPAGRGAGRGGPNPQAQLFAARCAG